MVKYELLAHPAAKRELDQLPPEAKHELTDILFDVAEREEPSLHEKAKWLEGQPGWFRVRSGNLRAILTLDKPELYVLACGHRKTVYDNVDSIHNRAPA